MHFNPISNAGPSPGMVLRIGDKDVRYLRVTHVFDKSVYAMWVAEPERARYARRPIRFLRNKLKELTNGKDSAWGTLDLPSVMTTPPAAGSAEENELNAAWELIQPLAKILDHELNLSSSTFTALIRNHADNTSTNFLTLRRMLLRYYYYGRTRFGLIPLPSGAKPSDLTDKAKTSNHQGQKRRGRQSVLTKDLGRNDFIVSDDDVDDMIASLKRSLRKGVTYITSVHEDYLAGAFRKRHQEVYSKYIGKEIPEPVSTRQFRYYVNTRAKLSEALAENLRTFDRNPGSLGAVRAAGPGELYEIDATGGRLFLVTDDENPILVGKPTIYVVIDRWSRYVVAVYLSLQAASYEEVRHALLVAFTSRERRFKALGIDVDDERWPIGRMCAVLCPDRGSDFMSNSMEQAVVNDLRVELTPLPPLCPDGKAIVERFIRELKRRLASSGMKGSFADRPLDPKTKRAAKEAQAIAIHSLAEAYRALIEIVIDHNNRPHSALKRIRALTRAGIEPTPRNAYLWGLENMTGLRRAPLSEKDYYRMLLSSDKASISSGVLRYRNRPYEAANEAAVDFAARSPIRPKAVDIKVDKTAPQELYIPTAKLEWAKFRILPGAANDLAGMSLDEEEAFSSHTNLLWARADHESRLNRVSKKARKSPAVKSGRGPARSVPNKELLDARKNETSKMKQALTGKAPIRVAMKSMKGAVPEWKKIEDAERLRNLEIIRKARKS